MPSGRTHNVITSAVSAIELSALICSISHLPNYSILILPLGTLSGIFLTPDHDIERGNITSALVYSRLGLVPMTLWQMFWYPYARVIPHRFWASHFPVISTIIRVAYSCFGIFIVITLFLLLLWIIGGITSTDLTTLNVLYSFTLISVLSSPLFWWWFIGLCIADLFHWLADMFL